jgi:hypothetical protein
VPILFEHTGDGPVITGAGVGSMLILRLMVLSQPALLVCFTVNVPVPLAPQSTLMLLPEVLPCMIPPEMDH